MKRLFFAIPFCTVACFAQYHYPATKTQVVSDTYFGTRIDDPYRWLENVKDPEVLQWFQQQDDFTEEVLRKLPHQNKLIAEMRAFDDLNPDRYIPIAKGGNRYFFKRRSKEEAVFRLYYREGENGPAILLFDPTTFIAGKVMDFQAEVASDGSRVLLNLSESGSETGDIRILDVATVTMLPDVIRHADGFFVDGSNEYFFYYEYKNYDVHDPEVRLNMPAKIHRLGTDAAQDMLIASAKKYPELQLKPSETPMIYQFEDSPYIFLSKQNVENHLELYFAPASELFKERINWKVFSTKQDEVWRFFVHGTDVYILTSKGNPRFRVIKTNLQNPDFSTATEIAAGDDNWKLSEISQAKDYLVISKSRNELLFEPFVYEFKTGTTRALKTPLQGNAEATAISRRNNEIGIINSEWNIPLDYYLYNLDTNTFGNGPFHSGVQIPGIEDIVYEEIEVPSHDGALVPLSLVYNKTKLKKDGSNIAYMSGYGSYGRPSYLPTFSTTMLPLLNRGVIMAFAHIRGGGEKGQSWYLSGKKSNKPNTWKDFNACAEYLISNHYTSPQTFGITGASAGGILIGRAVTERPDLYRVAIPKVGCLNTMRMEFSPNGPSNIPEFGTVTLENEFRALLEMDAFHHLKKGQKYPALLITTGFNDSRVESYIPAKFAAKAQASNSSSFPVLLDVNYKAGHFGGSTVEERYAEYAKDFTFLLSMCGAAEFTKP